MRIILLGLCCVGIAMPVKAPLDWYLIQSCYFNFFYSSIKSDYRLFLRKLTLVQPYLVLRPVDFCTWQWLFDPKIMSYPDRKNKRSGVTCLTSVILFGCSVYNNMVIYETFCKFIFVTQYFLLKTFLGNRELVEYLITVLFTYI